MVRNTPKNAEPTAKAKLPPFVRGLLCISTVLLVCFVVSIVLEVWYCKSAPNAAIKLAACLPHSDHRGARCAPVTLRNLLWRNLRQSPPLRDDASIVPYKSCATFAAHGKAEFLCGGVYPYPLQGKIRFSTR